MFSTGYVVLLVDDEPDVLQVSKLAMRNFKVFGTPIKLHAASNKAGALELYETTLSTEQGLPAVAVAFIDVVMETDHAGLELCEYIRDEQGNHETQIYVRTGQPGTAPERSVIDRYNISGYFTKVEATEDKLYSLTKSGVRQYEFLSTGRAIGEMTVALVEARSRDEIAAILGHVINSLAADATGAASGLVDPRVAFLVDGDVVASAESLSENDVTAAWHDLGREDGVPLGEHGDRFVVDGDRFILKVPAAEGRSEVGYLAHVPGEVPETFPGQLHGLLRVTGSLWHRTG